MKKKPTSVVIDPLVMNITNKIAIGTAISGSANFDGGVLIEGEFAGDMKVAGPLVLLSSGRMNGRIEVTGDAYIFGVVADTDPSTLLEVRGELHLTNQCKVAGSMKYNRVAIYQGAHINGNVTSLHEA